MLRAVLVFLKLEKGKAVGGRGDREEGGGREGGGRERERERRERGRSKAALGTKG